MNTGEALKIDQPGIPGQAETRHFTAIKTTLGWQVYNGTPDNRGERASHNSFTDQDCVFDYCERASGENKAHLHFDMRGRD